MRIAILQFNPQIGNLAHNLKRAESIIARENPSDIDLLILPEMAFTGYNFASAADINFHLEPTAAGPSTVWARTMARRFKCYVCVGYPEYSATSPPTTSITRYNSAVMVSPKGNVVVNYRKHHLFMTDETWAAPGRDGFYTGDYEKLGRFAMGICMDINPERFLAPFKKYEFANHVLESQAELVLMPMAWLTTQPTESLLESAQVPDAQLLAYWVQRLQPLIDAGLNGSSREVIFVAANRTGVENNSGYAGTSVVLGILNGSVKVYGCLGRGTEDLLVVDIPDRAASVAKTLPPGW